MKPQLLQTEQSTTRICRRNMCRTSGTYKFLPGSDYNMLINIDNPVTNISKKTALHALYKENAYSYRCYIDKSHGKGRDNNPKGENFPCKFLFLKERQEFIH